MNRIEYLKQYREDMLAMSDTKHLKGEKHSHITGGTKQNSRSTSVGGNQPVGMRGVSWT